MKKCAIENCNIEINQWATYCQRHYNQVMEQKSRQAQKEAQPQPHTMARQQKPQFPPRLQGQGENSLKTTNQTIDFPPMPPLPAGNIVEGVTSEEQFDGSILDENEQTDMGMQNETETEMEMQEQEQVQEPEPMPRQRQQHSQNIFMAGQSAKPMLPRFEMPELSGELRLDIKKIAFTGALNFIITQNDEGKEYDELIEQIRTLTATFFAIIVEKNENSTTN